MVDMAHHRNTFTFNYLFSMSLSFIILMQLTLYPSCMALKALI